MALKGAIVPTAVVTELACDWLLIGVHPVVATEIPVPPKTFVTVGPVTDVWQVFVVSMFLKGVTFKIVPILG